MKPLHKLLLFAGLAFLLLPILLYFSQNSVRGSQVLSRVLNGEIVDYINYYRAHLPLGRTQYIAKFDFSSLTNLCLSTANILFHYWFEPFPSRVESLSDLAVFFEVQCQTLLLLASLYLWFRSKDETKKVVTYLMLLYITLSLLWAAGTGNVGTAIRHHMLGTWIIILLGIPGFALWRNNLGASLYRIIMPPIKLR